MATDELIRLIDLSLGVEPQGVVNFNYLHGLLHEIVRRLLVVEGIPFEKLDQLQRTKLDRKRASKIYASKSETIQPRGESPQGHRGQPPQGHRQGQHPLEQHQGQPPQGQHQGQLPQGQHQGQPPQGQHQGQLPQGQHQGQPPQGQPQGQSQGQPQGQGFVAGSGSGTTADDEEDGGGQPSSTEEISMTMPRSGSLRQTTSNTRSRPGIVTAANDLDALERKLYDLEQRVNTMDSLPDMLAKLSTDSKATPVSDLWNFTTLDKRLTATEEWLGKHSKLVDDLLAEFQNIHSRVVEHDEIEKRLSDNLAGEIENVNDKLKELEQLKHATTQESMGDAAVIIMEKLDARINKMEAELNDLKNKPGASVSDITELNDTLKEHRDMMESNKTAIKVQNESLADLEKAVTESSEEANKMTERVRKLEEEVNKIHQILGEMQADIRNKVNASDLTSFMPQSDSGEAASLLPKVLEVQTRVATLEAQVPTLSTADDVQSQMSVLRNSIDTQTDELTTLSNLVHALEQKQGSDSQGKLEELGSQLAQLRERMNELDRGVTAMSDHMAHLSHTSREPTIDPDGAKYVDVESFNVIQGLLGQLQQEHERLMGTAAHLSHELDINKEHVKSLYDGVDDLKNSKADKTQVEVEVREKADRKALDDKASRDWVDSTFDKLDKAIREAKSKMLGQEEAFKSAVNQLNEDVETKLDRMELQPLKDYFEKKLDHVKTFPKTQELVESSDDAAGIKKPLRFACLSCDRPVKMKQTGIVPTLPTITTFPGTRTFRPYTTYELEMIRRHQKLLYPVPPFVELSRSTRSAGGSHTLTRPHQRYRLAPYGTCVVPTPEPRVHHPPHMASKSSPMVYEETDIIGHDGQIYKGRVSQRRKLPPASKHKGRNRPLTSPLKQNSN